VTVLYRKQTLATPNYGYEKRQKELAKKRKKEDKLKAKAERKLVGDSDAPQEHDAADEPTPEGLPPAGGDTPA